MENLLKEVKVTWFDCTTQSGWFRARDVQLMKPAECISKGYLLEDRPDCIVIATTVADDGDVNTIKLIPKISIKKVKVSK